MDGYEKQAISEDHSGIVKFHSDTDSNYRKIMVVLKRWIEGLQQTGQPDNTVISILTDTVLGGIVK